VGGSRLERRPRQPRRDLGALSGSAVERQARRLLQGSPRPEDRPVLDVGEGGSKFERKCARELGHFGEAPTHREEVRGLAGGGGSPIVGVSWAIGAPYGKLPPSGRLDDRPKTKRVRLARRMTAGRIGLRHAELPVCSSSESAETTGGPWIGSSRSRDKSGQFGKARAAGLRLLPARQWINREPEPFQRWANLINLAI
jgi:hypothetical protein